MGENGTRKGLGDYQGATPVRLQKAGRSSGSPFELMNGRIAHSLYGISGIHVL